jgi:hypothetical protein
MENSPDMRIPVLFGDSSGETDAVWLVETGLQPPVPGHTEYFTLPPAKFGHITGCTCCTPRGPAADALARLFRARATGTAPFFKRVIVLTSPEGEAAVRQAIASDIMTAARYCLAGGEDPS